MVKISILSQTKLKFSKLHPTRGCSLKINITFWAIFNWAIELRGESQKWTTFWRLLFFYLSLFFSFLSIIFNNFPFLPFPLFLLPLPSLLLSPPPLLSPLLLLSTSRSQSCHLDQCKSIQNILTRLKKGVSVAKTTLLPENSNKF